MKSIFQKNLQFGDIRPRNRQKIAQSEVFDHFLDFASLVFLDFAHNDRWAWCLVVFLQFAAPVNVFLFFNAALRIMAFLNVFVTRFAISSNYFWFQWSVFIQHSGKLIFPFCVIRFFREVWNIFFIKRFVLTIKILYLR